MAASKKKAAKKTAKKAAKKAAKKPAKKAAKASAKKAKPAKKAAKKPAKKAAKKPAKKKASAKKSATAKPKAAKKPAKKAAATPKKAAKKAAAAPKQAPKKAAAKKSAAAAKKASSAAEQAAPKKAATKKGKAQGAAGGTKKARAKKPILPVGPRHPKLGYKWTCFGCAAKFYDLGKEEPICPKCSLDQRDRPPDEPKQSSDASKPKVVRPMAQLLDDEEPAPSPDDDLALAAKPASPTEVMFDDTEGESGGLDIDDEAEVDNAVEPPEIDVI